MQLSMKMLQTPQKRKQHPEDRIEPECYFSQEIKYDSESSTIFYVYFFFFMKHLVQNISTKVCFIDILSTDINNVQGIGFVVNVALWNHQNKV